jgi:predicted dehydrogenase
MTRKLRTAVVGVGYLGTFHAEKLAALPQAELVAVADLNTDAARRIADRLQVAAVSDPRQLLDRVEAVSIAVPTRQHYGVARDFLDRGIHVLLEKPIAATLAEAQALVELAAQRQVVFQIGHLERFNPVIQALPAGLAPRFIEAHRLAPFKPRGTDVNVIMDLMIHDLDIILKLVNAPIERIDASGMPVLTDAIDIANVRLQFANRCVANITASRVSLKAERKMRLFQSDAYVSLDFQQRQLAIYRKSKDELYPGIPAIVSEEQTFETADALAAEIAAFVQTVLDGGQPLVTGEDGLKALAVALEIGRQLQDFLL